MGWLLRRRTLHRITAHAAIALVLVLFGLALNGFAHAHDDYGWHAHAGVPVPESPIDEPSDAPDDGHRGHDLKQFSVDLITRAPTGRTLPDQNVATASLPAASVVAVPPPPMGRWSRIDAPADPPPLIRATSGTARVLRASHSLRF